MAKAKISQLLGGKMKGMIAAVIVFLSFSAKAAYFDGIWDNPTHPITSLTAFYSPSLSFDGMATSAAIIYHRADIADSILPKSWLAAGVQPVAWSLLDFTAGGDSHSAFISIGPSVNLAQSLLGPVSASMQRAGGNCAMIGKLLVSPDGAGLRLAIDWKGYVLQNGEITRLNQMRFPPRYGIGYTYPF
jgi:hypothetical protein